MDDIFELEEASVDDPIPIFSEIFELEELSVDEPVPMNCVSGVSGLEPSLLPHSRTFFFTCHSHVWRNKNPRGARAR